MTRLHDALAEIADEAPAVDLADRAIRGNRQRKRTTMVLAAAATAVVASLAIMVGTGLLPLRGAGDIAALPREPRTWEIKSSPLPKKKVGPLAYAYTTSCPDTDVPPDCKPGRWRVVTRAGDTYDVPQALGLTDKAVLGPLTITPDGRALAYYSDREQKFKIRDLASGKELTAPVKVPRRQLESEVFLRVSDNGRHLAFTSFAGKNGLLIDMRNGRTTPLPAGWMPVSVADDGDPAVVVTWKGTSSRVRLVSPGGVIRESSIPEYGQRFSALAPDGRTMAKVGETREGDGPFEDDGTLVVFDTVTGGMQGKIKAQGLPEDAVVLRLGNWLNDTEIAVLVGISDGRHIRDDLTTVYGMNVRTGEVRKTGIYPVGNARLPGIVM
ncbi:TolB family protein [Streptosporangium roseum]|uniref:TolB family protein n=1 Tax=Streptosporangium roseum TaxID=2001 RepID=UPI0033301ED7